MSEFKGEAGTIYIERSKDSDEKPFEVWFEDFCILGCGDTDLEALYGAAQHVRDISALIGEAIVKIGAEPVVQEASGGG